MSGGPPASRPDIGGWGLHARGPQEGVLWAAGTERGSRVVWWVWREGPRVESAYPKGIDGFTRGETRSSSGFRSAEEVMGPERPRAGWDGTQAGEAVADRAEGGRAGGERGDGLRGV